ncbi:MAG: V-type ATP synthase subunit E family protein [Candidatus Omnitrophota bacterium]|nr:V-type ATP synthase subunit E family protein [Candidatus Omnitrophota bacterium]
MKSKDVLKINGENAEEICSKIREESSEESELLLGRAHKERDRILSEAVLDAEREVRIILAAADERIAQNKERIFSVVNMEKKRVLLEARSLFVEDVMSVVKKEAEKFRANGKDYAKFLKEAILEGIEIVDDPGAQVFYSGLDEEAISREKDLPIEFKKSDFKDIGVIVQSADGRLSFDNRFSARLKRAYDEIYMKLLKEAF